MAPAKKSETPPLAIQDPSLGHYCHKNKLDPKDRYFLPSGIQVCKECAAGHARGAASETAKKVQGNSK
jgi:hypothetical protein